MVSSPGGCPYTKMIARYSDIFWHVGGAFEKGLFSTRRTVRDGLWGVRVWPERLGWLATVPAAQARRRYGHILISTRWRQLPPPRPTQLMVGEWRASGNSSCEATSSTSPSRSWSA